MGTGKVYLVGAGPGDPELLTLKGRRALEEADCVVYDRLANPRLLEYARPDAEQVYVGKESGQAALTQDEINELLVARAAQGKTVCRLKGGDPFVFGRGGEEADVLVSAGVRWEYVPGVTSPIAVPGYAGIPVTYRGLCSTLAVITAHEDPAKGEASVRWDQLATGADTLVILMGAERLETVIRRLIEHGRPPETPAAVVSWGTYPRQRTVLATLATIAERCREAGCIAPAVTVIGEVAALRERLQWFDRGPLFGKRVVVTRAREQAGELARLLEGAGAEPLLCPTIAIQAIEEPDLSGLDHPYDWVVFTSTNGVYFLTAALRSGGWDIRRLGSARIAAIGPETAKAAESAGLKVDFVPTKYVAEHVAAEFPEPVAGKRVLVPRAREARELLPRLWREQGAHVDVVPVYETVLETAAVDAVRARFEAGEVDVVTFTASSTVRHFAQLFPGLSLDRVCVACIGPVTADTVRELGWEPDVVAETHTVRGLVEAMELRFAREPSAAVEPLETDS